MSKANRDVELSNDEIESEIQTIDSKLDKLIETAPFNQHKIENLISRRNLLDDVLLERQTRSI